jgi:enoyl-CoA hydratase/carnithine racemase
VGSAALEQTKKGVPCGAPFFFLARRRDMAEEPVLYERRGAAALVTINRPQARNAVNGAVAAALLDGYRRFEADADARVLVLTGAGDQAFCAGADLKAIDTVRDRAEGPPCR